MIVSHLVFLLQAPQSWKPIDSMYHPVFRNKNHWIFNVLTECLSLTII